MVQIIGWAIVAFQLLLTSILLPSALGKFRNWRGFSDGVVAYRLGSPTLARGFGRVLPVLEVVLAIGLWWPSTKFVSSLGLIVLFLIFSAAVAYNLRRNHITPCFCAGVSQTTPITWGIVVRNSFLTLLCLGLALGTGTITTPQPITPTTGTLIMLTSAGLWLIVQFIEHSTTLAMRVRTTPPVFLKR